MECKYCSKVCIKSGKQKDGTQRYYCKGCKKFQQKNYCYKACASNMKNWIPKLLSNGVGIRGMARVLEVSVTTIIKYIKAIASAVTKPKIPLHKASIEIHELRTYIGYKENQYWVAYAMCSKTKAVLDYIVCKRNKSSLRILVNNILLSGVEVIKTDRLNIYQTLIPKEKHKAAAYNINYIERNNLTLRTHLKRLSRRTICYSKSVMMLVACIKIYFWIAK